PASKQIVTFTLDEFKKLWQGESRQDGVALLLEPTPAFNAGEDEDREQQKNASKVTWTKMFAYLLQHRGYFIQIILGLLAASLFHLLIPFLTQGIVDKGVNLHDTNFVYLALIAQ